MYVRLLERETESKTPPKSIFNEKFAASFLLSMAAGWLISFLVSLSVVLIALIAKELFQRKTQENYKPTETEFQTTKQDLFLDDLAHFTGNDGPIYVAICGHIFDVTRARTLYGPGGEYHVFAGHDASYGLATTSLAPNAVNKSTEDLSDTELDRMREWKSLFERKYPKVGKLLDYPQ